MTEIIKLADYSRPDTVRILTRLCVLGTEAADPENDVNVRTVADALMDIAIALGDEADRREAAAEPIRGLLSGLSAFADNGGAA